MDEWLPRSVSKGQGSSLCERTVSVECLRRCRADGGARDEGVCASREASQVSTQKLTTVCAFCGIVTVEGREPQKAGICEPCKSKQFDGPDEEEQDIATARRMKISGLYYKGAPC